MTTATMRLIELAERLTPSGEIGDGLVAQFHEAATLARLEQPKPCPLDCDCVGGCERERYPAPYGRHADGRPRELHECD